jgi:hypothetical protein
VKADALVGTVMPAIIDVTPAPRAGTTIACSLATVSSLSRAPIGKGDSTTGKVRFDVVGDVLNSVVFNNGFEDPWAVSKRPIRQRPVAPRPAVAPPPVPAAGTRWRGDRLRWQRGR